LLPFFRLFKRVKPTRLKSEAKERENLRRPKMSGKTNPKKCLIILAAFFIASCGNANADYTFGTSTNLGPTVNSSSDDGIAHTSADGLELYFNSERPGGYGSGDLYVARRQTIHDDWGPPVNLGPTVNSPRGDWGPNLSGDGLTLFFASGRPGGYGSLDIWVTTRETTDADWSAPVNLGATVNSSAEEICPAISADGLQLYFSEWEVFRPGGYGYSDMWVTTRDTASDPWGSPVNLGPVVNSSAHDDGPFVTADGLALFFSSDRPGPYGKIDIFVARRATTDDDWGTPVNLGPTINSSGNENVPRISADGSTLYFSSNRPVGGRFDLWQASILPVVDFNGDGIVETNDLLTMIEYWGTDEPLCDIGPTPFGDGIVDVQDLMVLSEYLMQEVYDPTLIAHWPLDEAQGGIAYNSATDCDGTLMDGPVWQPDGGVMAGALQFDGIDDYVSTDFVLNPADGPFSVFAWIKGGDPGQVIISQAERTVFSVTLPGSTWLSTDPAEGKLMTELKTPGRDGGVPIESQCVITDGAWHHIGFVWDGSYRYLYVDRAEVAKDTESFSILESSRGGLNLGAGKNLDAASFFSGLIDDVRIYTRAVRP